jgi:hypothetical protein
LKKPTKENKSLFNGESIKATGKDALYFDSEMVERIKQSMKQIEEGKAIRVDTADKIDKLLGL